MPTYEYRCESCGRTVEVVQRFSDAPLTTCESCAGALRKVYAPVGIVFKGSGFYKNDSRSMSKSASRASSETGTESGGTREGAPAGSDSNGASKDHASKDGASKEPTPAAAPSPAPAASAAPSSD